MFLDCFKSLCSARNILSLVIPTIIFWFLAPPCSNNLFGWSEMNPPSTTGPTHMVSEPLLFHISFHTSSLALRRHLTKLSSFLQLTFSSNNRSAYLIWVSVIIAQGVSMFPLCTTALSKYSQLPFDNVCAETLAPPALSPKIVIEFGFPPKFFMLLLTQAIAKRWS